MRVFGLLLFMGLQSVALANEKVEEIIVSMGVKDGLSQALETFKPYEMKIDENDTSEVNELLLRHRRERIDLYEHYFSWGELMPDVVAGFESVYTKEEIESIYRFLRSAHGAKFFESLEDLEKANTSVLRARLQDYHPEFKRLNERHSKEFDRLIEKEAAKQNSLPKPEVDPDAPTSIGDIVRFMVATQNGEMIGYKVRPGRVDGLFEKSGFKEGDVVVSVNGLIVNEPNAVRDVYHMLKESRRVLAEVKRGGEFVDFVIDLDEIEGDE